MYKLKEWTFTGASGTKYQFSNLAKSDELPQSPGILILGYAHPRGHLAGWQVHPLQIHHSDNIHATFANSIEQQATQLPLWNCNLILLEPSSSAREESVKDLEGILL